MPIFAFPMKASRSFRPHSSALLFAYGNLRAMIAKYSFATLILFLKCVYPILSSLNSSLSLHLYLFLHSFSLDSYRYVSCFDLTMAHFSADVTNYVIVIRIFFISAQYCRGERTPHERQDSETRLRKNISLPMSFKRNS